MLKVYEEKCKTRSDINEHLPILKKYADQCDSVVECGVRNVVSSYAFAAAFVGRKHDSFTLIDPKKSVHVKPFLEQCAKENISAKFIEESDLKCEIVETDLLFIDTWHVYAQLKRELDRWSPSVKKFIILHDTTLDGEFGETVRSKWNADQQSKETGFPVEEINKGLWAAVLEFVSKGAWEISERLENNNGLTVLTRIRFDS